MARALTVPDTARRLPLAEPATGLEAPGCCTQPSAPPLDAAAADALSLRFRALADPARLRLLSLVLTSGSACICDLTEPVGLSQPTVSHHMRILVEAGLLQREKQGRWVHYSVVPDQRDGLAAALALA